MGKNPVSILMPVRNGATFLPGTIVNISRYMRPVDELVIVDDGSHDETPRILKEFQRDTPNVKIINGASKGLVSALNLGLKECSFDWVARMDVDDKSRIDRLLHQTDAISDTTVAIFSDYSFFSSRSEAMGIIYSAIIPSAMSISLVTGQRTAHSSVIFRKSAILDVGSYREEDFPVEDLSLWLRVSRLGELKSIPLPLLNYRISANSISALKGSEMKNTKKQILNRIGINPIDTETFLENFDSLQKSYLQFPDIIPRTLLLFRDYHRLIELNGLGVPHTNRLKKEFSRWCAKNPDSMAVITKMGYEKILRALYRKFG